MEGCFTFQWGREFVFQMERLHFWVGGSGAQCRVFPTGGMKGSPHHHQKSIPPPSLLHPTKQQFSRYNPIKTTFLAVVIAPVPVIKNNKKIILMIISII